MSPTPGSRHAPPSSPRALHPALPGCPAANELIRTNPAEAAALFIHNSNSKADPSELLDVLRDPQTRFDLIPHGFMRYVDFMHRAGTIRNVPADWKAAFVPELQPA